MRLFAEERQRTQPQPSLTAYHHLLNHIYFDNIVSTENGCNNCIGLFVVFLFGILQHLNIRAHVAPDTTLIHRVCCHSKHEGSDSNQLRKSLKMAFCCNIDFYHLVEAFSV